MIIKKKINKKENNFLISWNYIKESRNYIYFSLIFFAVAILFGFFNHNLFSDYINKFLKEIFAQTEGMGTLQLIFYILQNNIKSAFFGFAGGIFLGIFPLFTLMLNGYVLGYVCYLAVQQSGFSTLLQLLPHGIFELPALILSLSLGIKLGFFIFCKNKKEEFFERLNKGLRVFIFVIIPLLIIAGIIEGLLI